MIIENRLFQVTLFVICGMFMSCANETKHSNDNERIQPYSGNPYYWQYKGKPVLLLGGSDDDNLFNNPDSLAPNGLKSHLDLLVASGGNYVRNTMSDRDKENVYAFAREGDLYDLGKWNDEYWRRFENFLNLTYKRSIIVQIELWDMWDLVRGNWSRHPFNPANNINYTAEESGLLVNVDFDPAEEPTKHNFFHTVPELQNNQVVLNYQEAFIDKILDISLSYPNVLYCINNESGEPKEWSRYWALKIHRRAKEHKVAVQVTDMRRREDITHPTHQIVYDDNEIYTFADVSQNTGYQVKDRQLQYERLLRVREALGKSPKPINNVKIYNDNFGGVPKYMRNVFAGLASTRFHRPVVPWSGPGGTRGLGLSEEAQQVIRSVRRFTDAIDWFECKPRPDLLSHQDGVYLMALEGKQYALGFDGGGTVDLNASSLTGTASMRWMNMHLGEWIEGGQVEPGVIALQTPDEGLWMVLISVLNQ